LVLTASGFKQRISAQTFTKKGKEMTLSAEEKQQISEIRAHYISAILKRSQNPSGFNESIACLREFEILAHQFYKIIKPHAKRLQTKGEQLNRAGCNPLTLIKLKHDISDCRSMMKKASRMIFDKIFLEFMKSEFAKEPRITSLNFHEDDKTTKTYHRNALFEVNNIHNKNYVIQFSDGRKLTLHTIDDAKVLDQARKEFDNILSELSHPVKSLMY